MIISKDLKAQLKEVDRLHFVTADEISELSVEPPMVYVPYNATVFLGRKGVYIEHGGTIYAFFANRTIKKINEIKDDIVEIDISEDTLFMELEPKIPKYTRFYFNDGIEFVVTEGCARYIATSLGLLDTEPCTVITSEMVPYAKNKYKEVDEIYLNEVLGDEILIDDEILNYNNYLSEEEIRKLDHSERTIKWILSDYRIRTSKHVGLLMKDVICQPPRYCVALFEDADEHGIIPIRSFDGDETIYLWESMQMFAASFILGLLQQDPATLNKLQRATLKYFEKYYEPMVDYPTYTDDEGERYIGGKPTSISTMQEGRALIRKFFEQLRKLCKQYDFFPFTKKL